MRRTSHLYFDGSERMFMVAQPKRDHGQRGYAAPIDNGLENRKALSDPDAYDRGAADSARSAANAAPSMPSEMADFAPFRYPYALPRSEDEL